MRVILFLSLIFTITASDQSYAQNYEPIQKHSEFGHARKALTFLIKYEKSGWRKQNNNFYIARHGNENHALVYWKERETVYLWILELGGTKPETEIAYAKRIWNSKRDICPPAKCIFGSNYMMTRKNFLKMVKGCLKYGTHYAIKGKK